ncbi:hypothetical protein JHW43_003950 [Diplocarpon mali]|nr:hypothetical protein JHW43_003950 [Diplocarpon mali]
MSTPNLESRSSRLIFRTRGDENCPLSSSRPVPAPPVLVSTPQKLPTIRVTPATPDIPYIKVTPATPVARSGDELAATEATSPLESPRLSGWPSASTLEVVARLHPSDAGFRVAASLDAGKQSQTHSMALDRSLVGVEASSKTTIEDEEDPLSFDITQPVKPSPRPIASTPESRAQAALVARANLFYHYSASPSPMSPNLHQGNYAAEAEERACAQVLGGTKDWWLDVRDLLARYVNRLGAQDASRIRYIVVSGPAYAFKNVPRFTSAIMQLCLFLPNIQRACVSIDTRYPVDIEKKTAKGVAFWMSMLEGKLPDHERLQVWGLRKHPQLAKEWSRAKRK